MKTLISIGFAIFLCAWTSSDSFAFGAKSEQSSSPSGASDGGSSSLSSGATVWITRPDGTQQCSVNSGQSLEESSAELKKAQVRVLTSQKGNDSKQHAQLCGIPSGRTNMFQISREDLPKAVTLGYHEVKGVP
jgi:hypothetical protein